MRYSADEMKWARVRIDGREINNLHYEHDIALIAASPKRVQKLVDEVDKFSSEYNLEINAKKTKVMSATRNPEQLSIKCRGITLSQVEHQVQVDQVGAVKESRGTAARR